MGPTWVLSAPLGPVLAPWLAIRVWMHHQYDKFKKRIHVNIHGFRRKFVAPNSGRLIWNILTSLSTVPRKAVKFNKSITGASLETLSWKLPRALVWKFFWVPTLIFCYPHTDHIYCHSWVIGDLNQNIPGSPIISAPNPKHTVSSQTKTYSIRCVLYIVR